MLYSMRTDLYPNTRKSQDPQARLLRQAAGAELVEEDGNPRVDFSGSETSERMGLVCFGRDDTSRHAWCMTWRGLKGSTVLWQA